MKKIFASILLILSAAAGWRACLPARRFHESLALVFVVAAKPAHGLTAFFAALRRAAKDRRFDLAAEFGVFAVVEHQPGQAKRLAGGELAGQRDDDVRRGLDADDSGRAGPANDLRDPTLLR